MLTKIKLLFRLLLVTSFFIFSSCEKDLYEEAIKPENNKVASKKITFEEFKNKIGYSNISAKIRSKLERTPALDNSSQLLQKEGEDYQIYTNEIMETILGDKVTYSMLIEKNNIDKDKLYNIVFEQVQGMVKESIIEYKYDSEQKLTNIKEYDKNFVPFRQYNLTVPVPVKTSTGKIIIIDHHCTGCDHHSYFHDGECPAGDSWLEIQVSNETEDGPGDASGDGDNGYSNGTGDGVEGGFAGAASGYNGAFTLSEQNHIDHLLKILHLTYPNLTVAQNKYLSLHPVDLNTLVNNINNQEFVNWTLNEMFHNHLILNYAIPYFEMFTLSTHLSAQQNAYLAAHAALNNQIWQFYASQIDGASTFDQEQMDGFVGQILDQNPNLTAQQFQNWFMGESEGQDGSFNQVYWDNPNLTFPQQNLPSFNDFKIACPSRYDNAETLCNNIGGNVLNMYNAVIANNKKLNTCAIRVSRALNYSGIVIPALPDNPNGTKNTVQGADGKNYIISAKVLNAWMKKTFGTNPSNYQHYTASQGGVKGANFPVLLSDKKGIYSMVSLPAIQNSWGTGHADLLENGECLLKCHFYDENNNFVPIDYIDIWILD